MGFPRNPLLAKNPLTERKSRKDQVREAAEADLEKFIRLVHPKRVLGAVHSDVIKFWGRPGSKSHQLLLLPRDHQKSALVAYRVAWEITRHPAVRILYISSTSNLATKQLKFIKDILTSDIYRYYWPDMVLPDEAKREKWTETEISVDHPLRKAENVRDPTVFTAGLTTNIVGLHCDISVFDDVVVRDTAYTEEGRTKIAEQYSLLASIESADSRQWVVGTRYHPKDLYHTMLETKFDQYDETGAEVVGTEELYEVFERAVEDRGDGTGVFIWPRQQREDGKWFGFDQRVLARKRAQYIDKTQFRAQYYNDPNDVSEAPIKRDWFQYYDPKHLRNTGSGWTFQGRKLNIFAAIDFSYSTTQRADFTSLVVVGIDSLGNYYVLDIYRFKTSMISDYFKQIMIAHQKWQFRRLRAEATAAQVVIVKDLKENYIRPYGLALSIEEYKPTRQQGAKEERILATLQPRYENGQMWHYQDGLINVLEEELVLQNPPHDDVKDALAAAVDAAVAPTNISRASNNQVRQTPMYHSRFGGIA